MGVRGAKKKRKKERKKLGSFLLRGGRGGGTVRGGGSREAGRGGGERDDKEKNSDRLAHCLWPLEGTAEREGWRRRRLKRRRGLRRQLRQRSLQGTQAWGADSDKREESVNKLPSRRSLDSRRRSIFYIYFFRLFFCSARRGAKGVAGTKGRWPSLETS